MAISNALPVAEVSGLLAEVSDHGTQHLLEAEADLLQITDLLSEAIEKLSASFMAIHEGMLEQQAEVEVLLQDVEVSEAVNNRLAALREKVSSEVGETVTNLQFQDMTSQLIARVIKRVNGFAESLIALAEHGANMDPAHEHEEIVTLLKEMSASLKNRNEALNGGLKKSVRQEDMDSGEVELF